MRDAVRDREHVARSELVRLAAVDRLGAQLTGRDLADVDHLAAGDDGRAPFDDVHHVDDALVELDLAGRGPPAGVELVAPRVEQ